MIETFKQKALGWMRKLGWMPAVDRLYFSFNRLRFRGSNKRFRAAHPGVTLPPDYLLYEAYRLDYAAYYNDGRQTAEWVAASLRPFIGSTHPAVLEWGCGPARIIRHLPAAWPQAVVHGSDYNEATIAWCRAHIPGVPFEINLLEPPLPYAPQSFDAVYALSVFTHLSEAHHNFWMEELHRVLKPGGVALLTTQGAVFRSRLSGKEKALFDEGKAVVRGQVKEGHRSYSAFQSEAFMQSVFSNRWKVLTFAPGTMQSWGPEQDTWIVQKNSG